VLRFPGWRVPGWRDHDRRRETIAATGIGVDEGRTASALFQHAAQCRHMHGEVALFHHAIRPHSRHQRVFADRLAGVIQQERQNIQCPGAKWHHDSVPREVLSSRGETERSEFEASATVHRLVGHRLVG